LRRKWCRANDVAEQNGYLPSFSRRARGRPAFARSFVDQRHSTDTIVIGHNRGTQRVDRDKQPPAMANTRNAEILQVVSAKIGQDLSRNLMFGEQTGILLQTDLS
jgi:hypothetical protein